MPQTVKGVYRRGNATSRFLYGRVSNQRVKQCLTCLPNYDLSVGTLTSDDTTVPTTAHGAVADLTPYVIDDTPSDIGPESPGESPRWPPTSNVTLGESSQNLAGGTAAQNPDDFPGNEITWTWHWDDGTPDDVDVGENTTTDHAYTVAGTYNVTLTATDVLNRTVVQTFTLTLR